MDGFGFGLELKDPTLYDKFKNRIKYFPGTVVVAKKSPAGIDNEDLTGEVFIVRAVYLHWDSFDVLDNGNEEHEEQPNNLPFYCCMNASWDELYFDNSELKEATTPQIINLLKAGLLNGGRIPIRWQDEFYNSNVYR